MERVAVFRNPYNLTGQGIIMVTAAKAPNGKSIHAESEEADITTGIINGLSDYKEGRCTRLTNADELAEHFRNL
jgi:hypothetical protein